MTEKRKLSARQVLEDVKDGLSDDQLMSHHGLTARELQGVLRKLVEAGWLTQSQLDARSAVFGGSTDASPPEGERGKQSVASKPDSIILISLFAGLVTGWAFAQVFTKSWLWFIIWLPILSIIAMVGYYLFLAKYRNEIKYKSIQVIGGVGEFIKVPKNGVMVGSVGVVAFLVMIVIGYLTYAKIGQKREAKAAITRAFIETVRTKRDLNIPLIKDLIDQGADVNALMESTNTAGKKIKFSALHEAAFMGNVDLCKVLLEKNADPNIRGSEGDLEGMTPLMYAAANKHPQIVLLLMKSGADLNLEASNRATALLMAKLLGDPQCFAILEAQSPTKSLEEVRKQVIDHDKKHATKTQSGTPTTVQTAPVVATTQPASQSAHPKPVPPSSTSEASTQQPVKTARDSTVPDQRRPEPQSAGISSGLSPCQAFKEYTDKYVALIRYYSSTSTKSKCGGKTFNDRYLTEEEVNCLTRVETERVERLNKRTMGTVNDELQRKLTDLKRQYKDIIEKNPNLRAVLPAWEQSAAMCHEFKNSDSCSWCDRCMEDTFHVFCKTKR